MLDYNGSNQVCYTDGVIDLSATGLVSVSLWVNFDNTSGYQCLFDKRNSAVTFSWYHDGSKTECWHSGSGVVTQNAWAVSGSLHHLVLTFAHNDATKGFIYLDGVDDTASNAAGPVIHHADDRISVAGSKNIASWQEYLEGLLADVRIYNRILSLAEVKAIYQQKGIDNIKDYVGRWFMKELPAGSNCTGANVVRDISGNGNHGTPVNTPIYRADRLWRARKVVVI